MFRTPAEEICSTRRGLLFQAGDQRALGNCCYEICLFGVDEPSPYDECCRSNQQLRGLSVRQVDKTLDEEIGSPRRVSEVFSIYHVSWRRTRRPPQHAAHPRCFNACRGKLFDRFAISLSCPDGVFSFDVHDGLGSHVAIWIINILWSGPLEKLQLRVLLIF